MIDPEKKSRWIDTLMIVIIVAAMSSGLMGLFSEGGKSLSIEDRPAPAFNLKTLEGVVAGPGAYKDKVVILDFWATWCGPCRKQMPALQTIEEDPSLKERVVVLSINTDDVEPGREAMVRKFMRDNRLSLNVLLDNGAVSGQYGVSRIPTLVVIRPDGTVAYAKSGVLSEKKLRQLIDEANPS